MLSRLSCEAADGVRYLRGREDQWRRSPRIGANTTHMASVSRAA